MSINELYELPQPLDKLSTTEISVHELVRGQTLFLQSDIASGLFYLVSGAIDLHRTTQAGHSVMIHRARGGDTFAEASLFSERYHCTATAVRESRVVACRREALTRLLENDTDFALLMLARFATQIQIGRRRVELMSIRAADERVLAALNDGLLIGDIGGFAEEIALAPETVYRVLAKLERQGRITKTARGQYCL